MLSTSWVRLNGPALKFVLLWKGTLTRSAIGFCDFWARFSSSEGFDRMPGFCRRGRIGASAFEFVVGTELDHLKVAVQLDGWGRGRNPASQPYVIVFEFKRPMRFEAVLDTHSS